MILQERDGGLLLFRQTDHALLSGAFARAWGNESFPSFDRRASTLVAASRHDDGWSEWELMPTLRPDGQPVDFIRIPVSEHTVLYRRGIDLVEAEDPYAGLVASMHGERLYTRPFFPGMEPRIGHLKDGDLDLAQAYVDGERTRQERLQTELTETNGVEEAWRLLQVWDRLSLLVCMNQLTPNASQKMPPVASVDDDIEIVAHGNDAGELVLEPYPFTEDAMEFDLAAVRTSRTTWDDVVSYRDDFRDAERVTITFRCRAE